MNEQNPGEKQINQPVIDVMLQGWARNGRISSFKVSGNSMRPFLLPGDTLQILHGCENLRPGDLLAFRQNKTTVVHRLLQKKTERSDVFFYSKGDNNNQPDLLIPENAVIGRVIAIQRDGKKVDLDSPGWRLASQTIAFYARFSLKIEALGQRAKRKVLGANPNRVTAFFRHIIHHIQTIPGVVVSWIQWRKP